jgi:predicted AAA+ superfamily ATPase
MKYCTGIVDKAIQLVGQKESTKYRASLDPLQFMREYRIINLVLPRQVGKSTYIKTHATENDIIIYATREMMKYHAQGRVAPSYVLTDLEQHIADIKRGTITETSCVVFQKSYEIIWLDELSINRIYSSFTGEVLNALYKSYNEIVVSLSTSY